MHERPTDPSVAAPLLEGYLQTALAAPAALPEEAAAELCRAFARSASVEPGPAAHGLLAAIAYARPELLPAKLVAILAGRLRADMPGGESAALAAAFAHLAHTPLAPDALRGLLDAARRDVLYAALGAATVELLATFVAHRPELWSAEDAWGALPADAVLREAYVGLVLEPLLFRNPSILAAPVVRTLAGALADSPRWRRALATLAARREPQAEVRRLARARWPHRDDAARLRRDAFHLVILVNVRIGLGDETIRVGPLTQALLDANPRARITVVSPRPFLYDHPRVTGVAIGDARAAEIVAQPADGRFVIYEPIARHVVLRPELEELAQAVEGQSWLLLRGDVGRGYFLLQRARIGLTELAFELGLNRVDLPLVYDPMRRLLLELGLPIRSGEESPAGGCYLNGVPSAEARRLWRELVPAGRRAAVVNPFGGAHRLKGYLREQAEEIALGLASLTGEGFRVVLLPNGEAWSNGDIVRDVLDRLHPGARSEVVVAPDPAVEDPRWAPLLAERPHTPWADRVIRSHKYFIGYADLVVAVEGWAIHLAYQMGQPFRLLLRTDSDTSRWHPPWRGEQQVVSTDLARLGPPPGADALDGAVPVAPSLPRRAMLLTVLQALAEIGGEPALLLLRRAAASPDDRIRSLALRAMAAVAPGTASVPDVEAELLRHLDDPRAQLRAAAAEGLLRLGVDLSAQLGAPYARLLQAHSAIGHQRWQQVIQLGTAALPALARTLEDQSAMYRAEARWATAQILAALGVPALRRRGP